MQTVYQFRTCTLTVGLEYSVVAHEEGQDSASALGTLPAFSTVGPQKGCLCKGAATDSQHIEACRQLHSITNCMNASACQEGHLYDVSSFVGHCP